MLIQATLKEWVSTEGAIWYTTNGHKTKGVPGMQLQKSTYGARRQYINANLFFTGSNYYFSVFRKLGSLVTWLGGEQ